MIRLRTAVFGLAALALSACGSMDVVTRAAPFENTIAATPAVVSSQTSFTEVPEIVSRSAPELAAPVQSTSYNIVDVIVDVPRSLSVSEANSLIPNADIVWQEDAPGDRYLQVQTIVEDALEVGVSALNGDHEAILYVTVKQFHALTPRARYSVGGGHGLIFDVTVLDADTGAVLVPTYELNASFAAFGGAAAVIAERSGMTQKVRITDRLIKVIYEELSGEKINMRTARLG